MINGFGNGHHITQFSVIVPTNYFHFKGRLVLKPDISDLTDFRNGKQIR